MAKTRWQRPSPPPPYLTHSQARPFLPPQTTKIENSPLNVVASFDNAAKELAQSAGALAPQIKKLALFPNDDVFIAKLEEPKSEFLQKLT